METRITDTRTWPNSAHGHFVISVSGTVHRASGVLVGTRHVLTAAHNLDGVSPAKATLRFNPGQDEKRLPFGSHRVADAAIPHAWRKARDPAWDLAVLLLASEPEDKPGFFGVDAPPKGKLQGAEIAVIGYPLHLPAQMWRRIGRVVGDKGDRLLYTNQTRKGDSGGAVYLRDPAGRVTVVGVHRYRGDSESEGVRLTPEKLDFIHKHLT